MALSLHTLQHQLETLFAQQCDALDIGHTPAILQRTFNVSMVLTLPVCRSNKCWIFTTAYTKGQAWYLRQLSLCVQAMCNIKLKIALVVTVQQTVLVTRHAEAVGI